MLEKVIKLLKDNVVSIPKVLMTSYKDLLMTDEEFILLIYLLNNNVLDPKQISSDLKLDLTTTFTYISSLESKDILKIITTVNNGIREEQFSFEGLYNKLAFLIVNEKEENPDVTNLFTIFEEEFGRTLSPMEYEIIGGWKENKYTDELIIEALKEATYNGVSNLRYIDKILYEWKKKGYKTVKDIKKQNVYKGNDVSKETLYEYDWLNDNE